LLRSRAARALLDQSWCKQYRPDGSNVAEPEPVDVDMALASGRPFFGRTLPHVWAIDVDDPEHPAYRYLLTVLGDAGLDYIEADSGSLERAGRHVFVNVAASDPARANIPATVNQAHPDHRIDWRLQNGGSPIRPLLGLHRNGTTSSRPLGMDDPEAVEILERWYLDAYGELPHREDDQLPPHPLPLWAEALATGDYDLYHRLQPNKALRMADSHGGFDRSAIDLTIALAYRNAGRTPDQFVADRAPAGRWPSPKAAQETSPETYLRRQADFAWARPVTANPLRHGLERLDSWRAAWEADATLKPSERKILAAFEEAARAVYKTTLSLSWADIEESTGLARSTVAKGLSGPAVRRYLRAAPGEREPGHRQAYRLIVEQTGNPETPQIGRTENDRIVGSDDSRIPDLTHPVFGNRPGGLRDTGRRTVLAYSVSEPRTKAEARRHVLGTIDDKTFRDRTNALVAVGALVEADTPDSRKRYVLADGFAWDALAQERGLFALEDKHLDRVTAQRHGRVDWLADHKHWITPEEADERHRRIDERRATLGHRPPTLLVEGRVIDTETGEILMHAVAEMFDHPASPETNCAACGNQCEHIDEATGLRWHSWCDMPRWLVPHYERHGIEIPPDRIEVERPPATVDDYGIDWSDVPVQPIRQIEHVWAVAA
jgi:hypothetical protein